MQFPLSIAIFLFHWTFCSHYIRASVTVLFPEMVVIKSDALIIGSGVAGLMAALRFAKRGKTVAILAKADLKEGSTLYAQGGMSAVPLSETGQPLEGVCRFACRISAQGFCWKSSVGNICTNLFTGDTFAAHVRDTMKAGAGLCEQSVVEQFVEKAFPHTIQTLIDLGVEFTKADKDGRSPFSASLPPCC